MLITLASIFRDSMSYLDRYFGQADNLFRLLFNEGHGMTLVLVEGDSVDETWEALQDRVHQRFHSTRGVALKYDHGGQKFGSVDNPTRWSQISQVCNRALESVPLYSQAVIYVESDLIWEPGVMLALLGHLKKVPAVAPMCFHREGFFYDTWGHRKDGQAFRSSPPYHPALLSVQPGELVPIDSAGSCIVMRGEVARTARFDPPEEGIVGFCQNMALNGFQLYLDPKQRVTHP